MLIVLLTAYTLVNGLLGATATATAESVRVRVRVGVLAADGAGEVAAVLWEEERGGVLYTAAAAAGAGILFVKSLLLSEVVLRGVLALKKLFPLILTSGSVAERR
jgi:hypothetical protein